MLGFIFMVGSSILLYPVILEVISIQDQSEDLNRYKRKLNYFNEVLKHSKDMPNEKLVFDETHFKTSLFNEIEKKNLVNRTYKKCVDEYRSFYDPLYVQIKCFLKREAYFTIVFIIFSIVLLMIGII